MRERRRLAKFLLRRGVIYAGTLDESARSLAPPAHVAAGGVATVSAAMLLAEIQDIRRFPHCAR
jgi:hypothetical protein